MENLFLCHSLNPGVNLPSDSACFCLLSSAFRLFVFNLFTALYSFYSYMWLLFKIFCPCFSRSFTHMLLSICPLQVFAAFLNWGFLSFISLGKFLNNVLKYCFCHFLCPLSPGLKLFVFQTYSLCHKSLTCLYIFHFFFFFFFNFFGLQFGFFLTYLLFINSVFVGFYLLLNPIH